MKLVVYLYDLCSFTFSWENSCWKEGTKILRKLTLSLLFGKIYRSPSDLRKVLKAIFFEIVTDIYLLFFLSITQNKLKQINFPLNVKIFLFLNFFWKSLNLFKILFFLLLLCMIKKWIKLQLIFMNLSI